MLSGLQVEPATSSSPFNSLLLALNSTGDGACDEGGQEEDCCNRATDNTQDAAANATLNTALDVTCDEDWEAGVEIEGDRAKDMETR
jgi:hypothetical protein